MITLREYFEIDPRVKNEQWGDKLISHLRNKWGDLVNQKRAKEGMELVMSKDSLSEVKSMFADPEATGMKFLNVVLVEKVRNIVIAERNKAGVYIQLHATDPSAEVEKNDDYKLLQNRSMIEGTVSSMQQSIGLPPYKLSNEKNEKGKTIFKGNVQAFDDNNLDSNNPNHLNYFFQTHYKLRHVIRGQEVINHFVRANQLKKNIDLWCNDILAMKAIAFRAYVNEITGAIEYKYIQPQKIKIIAGKKKNCKDAKALGYEENVSVGEFIRMMGNSFDWERDFMSVLQAVNTTNGTSYKGIFEPGQSIADNTPGQYCTYSDFFEFNVCVGYIEFKTIDANAYKIGQNFHDNFTMLPIAAESKVTAESTYAKQSWYNEVTYKSYYLVLSSTTQKLYKFGKLYHQVIDGDEDEYSNFSIIARVEEGPTFAEIAKPFIAIALESFYKFKWFIRKAKPRGRGYSYESLLKVAQKMIGKGNAAANVQAIINMFEEGINEIYTYPEVDGKVVGGGAAPNYDKTNGLDPTAKTFSEILDWTAQQIADKVGINSVREAYSPSPNDGYKLQMQALQQSRNATDYISQMILEVFEDIGIYTLSITQDIIRYKDSLAYKYLQKAVGQECIDDLDELDGYAFHRYGIFIDTFNNDLMRQEIKADTRDAWIKGEIDYPTKLMIDGVDDPLKAGMILSFEKWRKEEQKQKDVAQQQANLMALEDKKQNNLLALEGVKGKNAIAKANVEGKWYYEALKAGADAKIEAQHIRNEAEPEKIEQKTQGEIKKEQAKSDLKNQQPVQ